MNPEGKEIGGRTFFATLETVASAGETRQSPFLERLEALYARMDRRYSEVADQYGFHCRGCEDSCCRTTFYHHTMVEYLYLRAGVRRMSKESQARILHLSRDVLANLDAGRFCPLNEEGLCLLYAYRPMICRLHGIAHELRRPDGTVHRGPGCSVFDAAARGKSQIAFERTEFYWELSTLEREARKTFDVSQKIKMTISHMLEAMLDTRSQEEGPIHETD
jgi:Fe-S-cluster containining protein